MPNKELTLSIAERVAAVNILNAFKGELSQLALFLDDLKKIAMTEEEWKNANLVKTPIMDEKGEPTGKETWNWTDKEEQEKKLDITGDTVLYLSNEIKRKSDAKEITMGDVALITLQKKLA